MAYNKIPLPVKLHPALDQFDHNSINYRTAQGSREYKAIA